MENYDTTEDHLMLKEKLKIVKEELILAMTERDKALRWVGHVAKALDLLKDI